MRVFNLIFIVYYNEHKPLLKKDSRPHKLSIHIASKEKINTDKITSKTDKRSQFIQVTVKYNK